MSVQPLPILVVEDNSMDVDLMIRSFIRNHLVNPIEIARDGEEALAYIQRWAAGEILPVVVLLDLHLPKVNGDEVLREYQNNQICRKMPVVLMVSSHEDPKLEELYLHGARSHIVKPVTFEKLAAEADRMDIELAINDTALHKT